jgi:hypothetical protein
MLLNLIGGRQDLFLDNNYFETFFYSTIDMDPEERGKYFKEQKDLRKKHEEAV